MIASLILVGRTPTHAQELLGPKITAIETTPVDSNGYFDATVYTEPGGYHVILTWKGETKEKYGANPALFQGLRVSCMTVPQNLVAWAWDAYYPGHQPERGPDYSQTVSPPGGRPRVSPRLTDPDPQGKPRFVIDYNVNHGFSGGVAVSAELIPASGGVVTPLGSWSLTGAGTTTPPTTVSQPGQVHVTWTFCTATHHEYLEIEDWNCDDCRQSACPTCVGLPVRTANGNMRFADVDPLPGADVLPLRRTYDSTSSTVGYFGRRWSSLFDARARALAIGSDSSALVQMHDESGNSFFFQRPSASAPYIQIGPAPGTSPSSLTSTGGGWIHSDPDRRLSRHFGGDGRIIRYSDALGRGVTIQYSETPSRPSRVENDWGRPAWVLEYNDAGRIERIDIENTSLFWQYDYDGDRLDKAVSPEGIWRDYNGTGAGDGWRITNVLDAQGHVVETHSYDSSGRATNSLGPTGDITLIKYWQEEAGRALGEYNTVVEYATGREETHYQRTIAGRMRTVEVHGGCPGCGTGDATYVYDPFFGNVIRHQGADGYITEHAYNVAGTQRISTRGPLRPVGCDPATDSAHCRRTPDALATAALLETYESVTTTYAYGDANWPDRPTSISIASLYPTSGSEPPKYRIETFQYDAATGETLEHTVQGWTGQRTSSEQQSRTTTVTLYGISEVAAFDPGGTVFLSAWLTLAQPPGARKAVDGPRPASDVTDTTQYVFYPIDDAVPARLRGRLAAVNSSGHIRRFDDYDLFGNVILSVDENAVQTSTVTDGLGRRMSVTLKGVTGCNTDPLCAMDLTTSFTYYGAGAIKTEQRPLGGMTLYEYDLLGRPSKLSRGPSLTDLRERIETAYDPLTGKKSRETKLAKEGTEWVEKTHDAVKYYTSGLVEKQEHADGAFVRYTYDPEGRVATVRDETHTSANTTYDYDPAGRLESVEQALSTAPGGEITTSYDYDQNGNLALVTDPNGKATGYVYDDFGQLIQQLSGVTAITTYAYDLAGNLTSTTDAENRTTVRTYDSLNRVLTATSTKTGSATETITSTYDQLEVSPFAKGRLTTLTGPEGAVQYTYDRRGLLLSEKSPGTNAFPYTSATTWYDYDADGNRSNIQYPSGLMDVTYSFDYAGRPVGAVATVSVEFSTTSVALVSNASYRPFGPIWQMTFGNGTTRTIDHDNRYRATFNTLTGPGGNIAQFKYIHDARGNVLKLQDQLDHDFDRNFDYDDLSRLTTARAGLPCVSGHVPELWCDGAYTYDSTGNMKTATLGGAPVDPSPDILSTPDPLARPLARRTTFTYFDGTSKLDNVAEWGRDVPSIESFNFRVASAAYLQGRKVRYDATGNETEFVASRQYSPRNLLAKVTDWSEDAATHSIEYGYDGRGVRVRRTESPATESGDSATRYFYYTPELQLLSVSEDTGPNLWAMSAMIIPMRHEIIWFAGLPIAQTKSQDLLQAPRYTFTDHLGTPILQTDSSANVVWQAEYEPFGNIYKMRVGERLDQPLRFPGQEVAMTWEGTEENYNIFRWYRTGWGRYTQSDPLTKWWGIFPTPFSYAAGNPLRFVDRLGLFAISAGCDDSVRSGARAMCAIATSQGTTCNTALRNVSLAMGQPEGQIAGCIKNACDSADFVVVCDDCSEHCGSWEPHPNFDLIVLGPPVRCGRGHPFRPRDILLHETLHGCGFSDAEPYLRRPGLNSYFRYLETQCR